MQAAGMLMPYAKSAGTGLMNMITGGGNSGTDPIDQWQPSADLSGMTTGDMASNISDPAFLDSINQANSLSDITSTAGDTAVADVLGSWWSDLGL
jgi:hypothetical protein